MRPGPGGAHVASGLVLSSSVEVWLGGAATATGVPVAGGRFLAQVDQDVPESVDVTLPVEWEGQVLDPARHDAVLGSDGHELALTVHLSTVDGQSSWDVRVGRFPVSSWERAGAGVRVRCVGRLQRVREHKRAVPRSPGLNSPIASELMRELADVGLTTRVADGVSSRPVSRDFVFGEDRLASVLELVAAWPARVRVDGDGVVVFLPPLSTTLGAPDVTFHDGEGGTLVGAPSEGSRDGVFNHVVVHTAPVGDVPGHVVEERITRGRLAVGTYNTVSRDPITTKNVMSVAQAQGVARQELAKSQLRARTLPVEAAADWRVELDDVAQVRTGEGVDVVGRVTGLDLPLTSGDGVARYNVGVVD